MNILFYMDLNKQLNDSNFRLATLSNSIIKQANNLVRTENVFIIADKILINNFLQLDIIYDKKINFIKVDSAEFNKIFNFINYKEIDLLDYSNLISYEEIQKLKYLLVDSTILNNVDVDIILSWECCSNYLRYIFKTAKMLYQMPGVLSREPYLSTISFNDGILKNYVNNALNNIELSDLVFIKNEVKKYYEILNIVNPFEQLLHSYKKKFKFIILFPLQIDNYFMIDFNNIKQKQLNILEFVLCNTPYDIGILVTNYISKRYKTNILTEELINYLSNRFPNFIYDKMTDNIDNSSQFLVPQVDGVITISSSLGIQGAMYSKPIFVFSEQNHIKRFQTANNYEDYIMQIRECIEISQQDKIINSLYTTDIPVWFLNESSEYYKFLRRLKNETTGSFYWGESKEYMRSIIAKDQINGLLKNTSFNICYKEALEQLRRYDIISFDIFDTLLVRPFLEPTELFDFMSILIYEEIKIKIPDFKSLRINAEKKAFKKALESGLGEVTLDDIYNNIDLEVYIKNKYLKYIKELEKRCEFDLLYKRDFVYKIYLEAVKLNKRIIVISDMYLDSIFLFSVLKSNGYDKIDEIYVSSKYKAKKNSGKLFNLVKNKEKKYSDRILHIGDNLKSDIIMAQENQIKAFHVVKPSENYIKSFGYSSIWKRDEDRRKVDINILLSIIGNKLYSDSYQKFDTKSIFNGKLENLGYAAFSLLLLGFIKWLIEEMINDGIDKVYFLSRDGKIMKDAYLLVSKYYKNAPSAEYLLCSRQAINNAKIRTEKDILDLISVDYANNMKLYDLFKYRFDIDLNSIDSNLLKKYNFTTNTKITFNDRNTISNFALEIKELIFEVANRNRNAYIKYLDTMGFSNNKNSALVDIGYAGTMQESLYQITNIKTSGYYLLTFRDAIYRVKKNGMNIKGYLGNFIDRHDTYLDFCRHVPLYESLFSSSDSSFVKFVDFNNKLEAIFMKEPLNEKRLKFVKSVHNGALCYIQDVLSILREYFIYLDIEPQKSLRILSIFFKNPNLKDIKMFEDLLFEDAYG
ncbi:HAD-IA family hydrolase, partial [Campylobacter sp. 2018MI01]|uniref:HAD-IA family hydrolase n=1 Tax=Campylobacter sp. 2018MI01 TaxID=2836735 RepID=UPI001BD9E41F